MADSCYLKNRKIAIFYDDEERFSQAFWQSAILDP